ncbi:hypothetical protein BDV12DRAFT_190273 [Aspergillus spectabilis]
MDRGVWDPIQVYRMSDPDCITTCYGKTQADANFQPLTTRWYKSACASYIIGQHVRDSCTESQQLASLLYPELDLVDVNSTLLIPMDLRQRSVQFKVLLSSPAQIKFRTANADNTSTPVILCSLRQDNSSSSIECLICHDNAADSITNLQCEQCRQRSTHINFNCPQYRGVTRFDASYSTAETMGEAEDGVESAGSGRTAREITSEGALVQDLRRSRRRTRRPDYYAP